MHPKILQQDKTFKDSSSTTVKYLQTLSKTEKAQYHNKTLMERFVGSKTKTIDKEKNKREKTTKNPTHITTLEMFKENPSIESIAAKRGLSFGTVIGHIEKLKGLKQLDQALMANLKNSISKNDFDSMFSELEKSGDGKLKPVYDKFEGKYSYAFIKIVRLFV